LSTIISPVPRRWEISGLGAVRDVMARTVIHGRDVHADAE
jgi:hypothetical protein